MADPINGIRQIIAGTGGLGMTPMVNVATNSEVRQALGYGVLKLTLSGTGYAWDYLPSVEGVMVDSGADTCR